MKIQKGLNEIDIRIVNSPEMFYEAMKVRHRVYIDDIKWLTEETLIDKWDDVCVHFIAYKQGEPVATRRLNEQPSGFEIEQYMVVSI
ncbi:hypothetical protein PITCH_A990001 [uncultured Desulfobacterium sp.]|uniref:GNAT family N-acetyltransferase n=1 Tax=uncultured Desulfobacterium sp. TaxID=201089 RepID=A0A445N4B4_9BACT|nr:hypothetical protein PITCH_A990001 [uncultured Desulfobacterium sp.]